MELITVFTEALIVNFSRDLSVSRLNCSVLSASIHIAGDMRKYPPILQWNGTVISTHGDSPGLF